jgi:hypothetical protein
MNDHPQSPGPDLEALLSTTLRAEAEQVETDPAALALIRRRIAVAKPATSFRRGFSRPALAGGMLAAVVALGTVVGINVASNDRAQDVVADPPATALAADASRNAESATGPNDTMAAKVAPAEGTAPMVDTPQEAATQDPGAMSRLKMAPQTPVHKIPLDDGRSPYVAITAPDSGSIVEKTVELKGLARAFEANVIIEVSQNGKVVKKDFATASAGAPDKGEWTKTLSLAPGDYKIEAYEESMKGDGTKLSSDTIWITVAAAPDASNPTSEAPAGPLAPAVDPAATPPDAAR